MFEIDPEEEDDVKFPHEEDSLSPNVLDIFDEVNMKKLNPELYKELLRFINRES